MKLLSRVAFVVVFSVTLLVGRHTAALAQADQGSSSEILLTLLHTNDLHGRIYYPDQPRGLAKIATLVREIRRQMPNVLLLDAGDTIHGTPHEWVFRGDQPIIHAMNAIPFDAMVAGNHEFDFGQDVTRAAIELAEFPILSANVRDAETGEPWDGLVPYIIREIHPTDGGDGFRVAIFGLTTPATARIQWPGTIVGIEFGDEVEAAAELVPYLREQERADVVIALTHLGHRSDMRLAQQVDGIDVILGGHSHTMLREQVWVNETLIMQTGAHAVALGRADLLIRRSEAGRGEVIINGRDGRWWGRSGVPAPAGFEQREFPGEPLILLSEEIEDDPQVVAAFRPYQGRLQPYLDEQLTLALERISGQDATKQDVPMGQLIADAVRASAGADIGLASSTQFGAGGLPAGPVHVRDLYRVMGAYTRQHIVIIEAPGERVRDMAAGSIRGERLMVQVSGLRVDGREITVGGRTLDDRKIYRIAGPAHVIQSDFLGREGVRILEDDASAPSVRDATIEYLRGHPPLTGEVEQRIRGR